MSLRYYRILVLTDLAMTIIWVIVGYIGDPFLPPESLRLIDDSEFASHYTTKLHRCNMLKVS